MSRYLNVVFAALIIFLSFSASAQICPASVVGGVGIGDGCTTSYGGVNLGDIPQIGVFRSTFTPACNNHDKCLTTLGTTIGECNGNFLSDMLSACNSSYLPLRPDVYLACTSSASAYRAAVDLYLDSLDTTAFSTLQANALNVSKTLQSSVTNDTCGTTPERTTLYSPNLIAHINSTFQTYAGRTPTIYEFLDAINASANAGDSLFAYDRATWEAYLISKAQYATNIHPPVVTITSAISRTGGGITFSATPVVGGASYLWEFSPPSMTATSPSITFYYSPLYDTTYQFQGFLKVTDSVGNHNMALIDTKIRVIGSCAPSPKYKCY